jgi:hypothetical protein
MMMVMVVVVVAVIVIIGTELRCYVLNMQQISQIIHVKVIQFADEKWLCNSQKIGVNPCKTS